MMIKEIETAMSTAGEGRNEAHPMAMNVADPASEAKRKAPDEADSQEQPSKKARTESPEREVKVGGRLPELEHMIANTRAGRVWRQTPAQGRPFP